MSKNKIAPYYRGGRKLVACGKLKGFRVLLQISET